MTQRLARDPGVDETGTPPGSPWAQTSDGVTIGAARCGGCGAVHVPFQTLGCRSCGSTDLTRVELAARGQLLASVVVWRHPVRAVPYTLGEIELDGGPIVLAMLDVSGADPGDRMVGAAVACTALSGDESPMPVFAIADAATAV